MNSLYHFIKCASANKSFNMSKDKVPLNSFSMSIIEEVIFHSQMNSDDYKFFREGVVSKNTYMSEDELGVKIDSISMNNLLNTGATLVINNLDKKSLYFGRLQDFLSSSIGSHCVINGYLCYGGKGSFGLHWDSHDVFVYQLVGNKKWNIFGNSIDSPVSSNKTGDYKIECPKEKIFSGIISAGDIFFMPRGCFHEAIPLNELSFHITIGVHKPKVYDAVIFQVYEYMHEYLSLRQDYNAQTQIENVVNDLRDILSKNIELPSNMLSRHSIPYLPFSPNEDEYICNRFFYVRYFNKETLSRYNDNEIVKFLHSNGGATYSVIFERYSYIGIKDLNVMLTELTKLGVFGWVSIL